MKTFYTIEYKSFDDRKVQIFTDRDAMCFALDEITQDAREQMNVCIYKSKFNLELSSSRSWTGKEKGWKKIFAENTVVGYDKDGEFVELESTACEIVQPWSISYSEGSWVDDTGEVYDTENEALEASTPSQYLMTV